MRGNVNDDDIDEDKDDGGSTKRESGTYARENAG